MDIFNKKTSLIIFLVVALSGGSVFYWYKFIRNGGTGQPQVIIPVNEDSTSDKSQNTSDSSSENFSENIKNSGQNQVNDNIADENADPKSIKAPDEPTIERSEPIDINQRGSTDGKMFARVTTENCDTGCRAYSMEPKFFEYCQQVCGIAPIKNVSNCDNKTDLEKDYCLKDLGINKSDSSICDKIEDENIKTTCRSRILEDTLEKQL